MPLEGNVKTMDCFLLNFCYWNETAHSWEYKKTLKLLSISLNISSFFLKWHEADDKLTDWHSVMPGRELCQCLSCSLDGFRLSERERERERTHFWTVSAIVLIHLSNISSLFLSVLNRSSLLNLDGSVISGIYGSETYSSTKKKRPALAYLRDKYLCWNFTLLKVT